MIIKMESVSTKKLLKEETIKGFNIEKQIGKGAFSTVYLCRKNYSRKKFAAKIINHGEEKRIRLETENEIEILKILAGYSGIVTLHSVYRFPRSTVCLLEYIAGENILNGVIKWHNFNEDSVKNTMKQMLKALSYCQQNRIVHRDLKPENIMIQNIPTEENPNRIPILKLIDFNLARKIPSNEKYIPADPYGNPSYMAPECLEDESIICFQSDIWSAGVIFFMLLGGYPPFWNDNYNHLIENIKEANYELQESLWNHVSKELVQMMKKMLQQDFKSRPFADEILLYDWFTSPIIDRSYWPSSIRLKRFLDHVQLQNTRRKSRAYSLILKERTPYIPDENIFMTENNPAEIDLNNNSLMNSHHTDSNNNEIVIDCW